MAVKGHKMFVQPVGGLANRMRVIDSSISLARKFDKDLVVLWQRNPDLNCEFSDLFLPSNSFKVIEVKNFPRWNVYFPYFFPNKRGLLKSRKKKSLHYLNKRIFNVKHEIFFDELGDAISALRRENTSMKEWERKSYQLFDPILSNANKGSSLYICSCWRLHPDELYYEAFRPSKYLSKKIDAVTSQFRNTVGLHIRRGDHVIARKASTLEKFKSRIVEELEADRERNFFLATDDTDTEKELKKCYSGKIITYPKASLDRNSPIGIQEGLVDLYCLSKTKKIIGSLFSSFSNVASDLSQIERDIVW